MKAIDLNTQLINSYLGLLNGLTPSSKLDLIAKLTQSIKSDIKDKKSVFEKSFGAWDTNENAELIAKKIKDSRTFNRNIERL